MVIKQTKIEFKYQKYSWNPFCFQMKHKKVNRRVAREKKLYMSAQYPYTQENELGGAEPGKAVKASATGHISIR